MHCFKDLFLTGFFLSIGLAGLPGPPELLAAALFREGLWVQSFPAFGVERRGAPVTAFLRVASERILLRCEVTEPDDLIVLDPTLIEPLRPKG